MAQMMNPQGPGDPLKERMAQEWDKLVSEGVSEAEATRKTMEMYRLLGGSESAAADASDTSNMADPHRDPKQSRLQAALAGAAQGMTFGFADEITAAMQAMAEGIPYDEALANRRKIYGEAREEHPGTMLTTELVGGAAIPLGVASKAKTLGGAMKAGAGTGAIGGAIGGAGNTEGGLPERAAGAVKGAAVGATVGAVAPPLIGAASKAGRTLLDVSGMRPRSGAPGTATASPRTGAVGDIAESVRPRSTSERAADKLLEAIEADRLTPADIAARRAQTAGAPKPETINELGGRNVLGLTETVNTIPGPSQEMLESRLVTGRIGERLGDDNPLLSRVRSDTERAFGLKAGSTLEAVDDIEAAMRSEAGPYYRKAFESGTIQDERLAALLKRPSARRGLTYAKELAEEGGEAFALPDAGAPVSIRTLHHIKLALDDGIAASKLDTSKGPTLRAEMIKTRNAIREILHSDENYRQGANIWAGRSALRDAVEEGERMFSEGSVRAEDVRRFMTDMTDSERTMFLQGATNAVNRAVGDVKDARNIVEKIAGSPNLREKMQAVLGKNYDAWLDAMKREDKIYQTRNTALRGSQTAGREAGKERLTDLWRTKPSELFKPSRLAGLGVEAARRKQIDAMAESLGPLLTAGTEGAELSMDELLDIIAQAEVRRTTQATRQGTAGGKIGRAAGQQSTRRP